MQRFGYQKQEVKLSAGELLKFYGRLLPASLLRMLGWIVLTNLQITRGEPIPRSRLLSENSFEKGKQYV
jgi:hypothetical protein